jgi:hypothetical protein
VKKVLGVIGVVLILGVAVYVLLNKKEKANWNADISPRETSEAKTTGGDTPLVSQEVVHVVATGYEDVKGSAIGNMYTRHEGVASIIKESVDTIRERVKISENTNNNIDQVSVELDKMSGED